MDIIQQHMTVDVMVANITFFMIFAVFYVLVTAISR